MQAKSNQAIMMLKDFQLADGPCSEGNLKEKLSFLFNPK
jgi:hypothetical protein